MLSNLAVGYRSKYCHPITFARLHLSKLFLLKQVEELFKEIGKTLLETRLCESIWRYLLSLLGQIIVIFVLLARNVVKVQFFY